MKKYLKDFIADESGATAIEYGLIAAGISLAIIAVVNGLGSNLLHIDQYVAEVIATRREPVCSTDWLADGSALAAIMSGLAALLLDEVNALDADAALGRLDHVVDGEAGDRHGGQRLHLDAGWAGDLHGGLHDAAGQFYIRRDVEGDFR